MSNAGDALTKVESFFADTHFPAKPEGTMPDWVLLFLGFAAGLAVVLVAVVFSFRRELGMQGRKRWLAPPSGRPNGFTIPGEGPMGDA